MNTKLLSLALSTFGCISFAHAETYKKANFTECLQSISENSDQFKGKIYPMSPEGWSFAVVDEGKKETIVHLPNGETYKISPTDSKVKAMFEGPHSCKNVTESTTQGKAGAGGIFFIYEQAMKDNKNTSLENRRIIKEKCALVAAMGSSGMMTSGGMMMGMPVQKKGPKGSP